jgi:uncharacterized protein DUF6789
MANRLLNGLVAGFTATFVISILMFLQSWALLFPQVNVIEAFVKAGTISLGAPLTPWIGWVEQFFIGTVLWGILYAAVEPVLPGQAWLRGILFSLGPWLLMMLLLMPAVDTGLFGIDLGIEAPLTALVLQVVYGIVLGLVFAILNCELELPPAAGVRKAWSGHRRCGGNPGSSASELYRGGFFGGGTTATVFGAVRLAATAGAFGGLRGGGINATALGGGAAGAVALAPISAAV